MNGSAQHGLGISLTVTSVVYRIVIAMTLNDPEDHFGHI